MAIFLQKQALERHAAAFRHKTSVAGSAGEMNSTTFKVDLQHKVHCGNARGQLHVENQRQDSQEAGDFITLSLDSNAG